MQWILVTLTAGLILVAAEVYVPGGVLGVLGFLSLVASCAMVFRSHGPNAGIVYTGLVIAASLGGIFIAFKLIPRSRMGRSLFLHETQRGFSSAGADPPALAGSEGTALTALRPSGKAEIGGKRVDVVTEGGMLERGARLRVLEVHGARVVVRGIAEN